MKRLSINPGIIEAVCRTLRLGAYQREAAAAAGISYSALMQWISKGGKERRHIAEGGKPRKGHALYLDLVQGMEKAQAEAQLSDLAIVTRAAQEGAWQAAAWKLERRNPDQWGRNRLEVQADGRLIVEGAGWLSQKLGHGNGG